MNSCLALTPTRNVPAPAADQGDESDTIRSIVFVPTGTPRLVRAERVDLQKHTHVHFIHVDLWAPYLSERRGEVRNEA
jgi:hypothetical protein